MTEPRGFEVQAARFSMYAAIWAFALNYIGMHFSGWTRVLAAAACAVLILGGLALGIAALVRNRRARRPGVNGYAVVGVVVNGIFLLMNLVGLLLLWRR